MFLKAIFNTQGLVAKYLQSKFQVKL